MIRVSITSQLVAHVPSSTPSVFETVEFVFYDVQKIQIMMPFYSLNNSFISYPNLLLTLIGTYLGPNLNPNRYLPSL